MYADVCNTNGTSFFSVLFFFCFLVVVLIPQRSWGPGWNGAKAYSRDGLTFNYTTDSMAHAWSSTVNYTDGSSVTFTRREEPKIYVEGGKMLAMFNAVQDPRCATTGNECTYVMSQAIKN